MRRLRELWQRDLAVTLEKIVTESEFQNHQRIAHEREITCDICGGWYNTFKTHKKYEREGPSLRVWKKI